MMTHAGESQTDQLRETCKLSKARWAVWLRHTDSGWDFAYQHGLTASRQAALTKYVRQPRNVSWLAGAFSSGRVRSAQAGPFAGSLGCRRVFVFPHAGMHCVLMVGADTLDKASENIFRILAIHSPSPPELEESLPNEAQSLGDESGLAMMPVGAELEMAYNPEEVLENVLINLAGSVQCDAAMLSIRSGDIFRVESVWNCPQEMRGIDASTRDDMTLSEMVANRQGIILKASEGGQGDDPFSHLSPVLGNRVSCWMGVPIVIGQRVIGLLAFLSYSTDFSALDLQRITVLAGRLAYAVENAMVFAEAARYLQQLALLNDLASAASLGVDVNEVSRRVMQRLRRTFRTELAGVFLLSPDGKMMREYGAESSQAAPRNISVKASLVGYSVETGLPMRLGDVLSAGGRTYTLSAGGNVRSELAVPLKYRGRVIGALALESTEINA
ncbi:MAG: GAF domain-containing protein, partial [Chloroflexota bacterium]